MRAIILAAGEGSRLRPLTLDKPKCLVEYRSKPILDYSLETFRACGIQDIVVVKGYKAETLIRPGVQYVINPNFATTNMVHTFFCARQYFDDDLIVSYGDIIYGPSILKRLLNIQEDFAVAVSQNWRELWLKRMENPLLDAETMKIDEKGYIRELGKKPKSYDEIQGQYMGLIKFGRKMAAAIQTIYDGLNRHEKYDGKDFPNMFMTSFLQLLIDQGYPAKAVPVQEEWLEVDRLEDLTVVCNPV